jgi:hypothetical protein
MIAAESDQHSEPEVAGNKALLIMIPQQNLKQPAENPTWGVEGYGYKEKALEGANRDQAGVSK